MKSVAIPLLCVLVTSLGVVLYGQSAESQDEQQTSLDNRINSLLAERRDTFRQLVELVEGRYKMGQTTLSNVIRERNRLLEAELEIAKTSIDRIRILEDRVKNFRDLENELKQLHKVGRLTDDKLLVAKAARLKAEIELLRE
jgi:hypothetical protein